MSVHQIKPVIMEDAKALVTTHEFALLERNAKFWSTKLCASVQLGAILQSQFALKIEDVPEAKHVLDTNARTHVKEKHAKETPRALSKITKLSVNSVPLVSQQMQTMVVFKVLDVEATANVHRSRLVRTRSV